MFGGEGMIRWKVIIIIIFSWDSGIMGNKQAKESVTNVLSYILSL